MSDAICLDKDGYRFGSDTIGLGKSEGWDDKYTQEGCDI